VDSRIVGGDGVTVKKRMEDKEKRGEKCSGAKGERKIKKKGRRRVEEMGKNESMKFGR